MEEKTKFCKHCGEKIPFDAIICVKCGRQVERMNSDIGKTSISANGNKVVDKWVSFFLCLLLGGWGAHKFYEGKMGMGILYIFTGGLLGIGTLIDLVTILGNPNPYEVVSRR